MTEKERKEESLAFAVWLLVYWLCCAECITEPRNNISLSQT